MIPKRIYFVVVVVLFAAARPGYPEKLTKSPGSIAQDSSESIQASIPLLGPCGDSNNSSSKTQYWIYTRDNADNPEILTEPNEIFPSSCSKIIFLAHGWTDDPNIKHILSLKDQYLVKYDACIVSIDWSEAAMQNYVSSYCALPAVARNIAEFICKLKLEFDVPLETIHAISLSMGAQLLGIAGSLVHEQCQDRIGRITALDPAGPLYYGLDLEHRLDPTDAIFVDVIHTNAGLAGYIGSCGHLDAYANCGSLQPGCLTVESVRNATSFLDLLDTYFSCSHGRSIQYFTESINSDRFLARPCVSCGLPTCRPDSETSGTKLIGEGCTSPGEVRNYVFYTNPSPPFAKG